MGSVVYGFCFRSLPYRDAFLLMGSIVVASSALSLGINIPMHSGLLSGEDHPAVLQTRARFAEQRRQSQEQQQQQQSDGTQSNGETGTSRRTREAPTTATAADSPEDEEAGQEMQEIRRSTDVPASGQQ